MKNIILLSITTLIISGSLSAADLTVKVLGIKESTGNVEITLFSSEADWLQKAYSFKKVDAQTGSVTINIPNVEPGEYGAYATHDVDADGQLKTGAFGKPLEAYGFSNDARKMFGPASWESAKFEMTEESKTITFTVK